MKKYAGIVLVLIVIAVNLFFGLPRLSKFSSVDEPYWTYGRIEKFWSNIKEMNWEKTDINDKPGITVALTAGPGYIFSDPMSYRSLRQEVKTDRELEEIQLVNFNLRLPIYLLGLLSLFAFYHLLKKLFGETVAVFSVIFIGLSPIILGMSLIINPDALFWIFTPLSILSYFVYQKENDRKYLYFSGIALGLALLTKYVANILYVYFLALIFLEYLMNRPSDVSAYDYLKKAILDFGILILVSIATFYVLYPATWFDPTMVLEGTILSEAFKSTWPIFAAVLAFIFGDMFFLKSKIIGSFLDFFAKYRTIILKIFFAVFLLMTIIAFVNIYTGMKMFDFESIMAQPKAGESQGLKLLPVTGRVLADLYALLFAITPVALLAFIWTVVQGFRNKKLDERTRSIVFCFLFFIIFYYVASTVNYVTATVRYQIMNYVLAGIIAAIGLENALSYVPWKKYKIVVASVFLVIISTISLISIRPHYLAYANSFLPQKFVLNLKSMGEGSYEAGRYLSNLPNARELTIWSDKGAVCESFVGNCVIGVSKKDLGDKNIDYLVVSTDRKSKFTKSPGLLNNLFDIQKLYDADGPAEFKITIDGRPNNYVRVIKADSVAK